MRWGDNSSVIFIQSFCNKPAGFDLPVASPCPPFPSNKLNTNHNENKDDMGMLLVVKTLAN